MSGFVQKQAFIVVLGVSLLLPSTLWGAEPENELSRFTQIATLTLPSHLQVVHLDTLRGTLAVRFESKLTKKRRAQLTEQVENTSLFTSVNLGEHELVLGLATLGVGIEILEEPGEEPILLVGSLREIVSPRAHFLASECGATFPEHNNLFLSGLVDAYCRGKQLPDRSVDVPLETVQQEFLELMLIEAEGARSTAPAAMKALLSTSNSTQLHISTGIGLALIHASRDELGAALESLSEARLLARQNADPRSEIIESIGIALFERVLRLDIESGNALRLVYNFERFSSWREGMDSKVLLALAAACIELEIPEFAAEFYLDAIHLGVGDEAKLMAALAKSYELAGDRARAREVKGFLSEQYPKMHIEEIELPTLEEARDELHLLSVACPDSSENDKKIVISLGCQPSEEVSQYASALQSASEEALQGI